MGVAPEKIIFVVKLSFKVALVSSPILLLLQKSKQTSIRKNL